MNPMNINWLAVVIAALLPMVVGSVWYGPLFGKAWMNLMGLTEETIKEGFNAAKSYGGSMVMAILMAFVLANVISMGEGGAVSGMLWGGLLWLGLIVPYGFQAVAFEMKKVPLYLMSIAYNLVALVLMGLVLGVWQ